mgnify:CR=1 FL=1
MPIADDYNFHPTPLCQQTDQAVVLHEHYVSTSGLAFCFQNNLSPCVVPKDIGRWGSSRHIWSYMLKVALSDGAESLTRVFTMKALQEKARKSKQKRLKPSKDSPFAMIDVDTIIHERAGFTPEETKNPEALFSRLLDIKNTLNSQLASEFISKILTLRSYDEAILAHSPKGRTGSKGKRDKSLPIIPTMEDLDEWVSANGIGFTRWMGDGNFFGWDGNPDSLSLINPTATAQYEDVGKVAGCPLPPVGMHILGWVGEKNSYDESDGNSHIVALLSVVDDSSHRRYREMHWHLEDKPFREDPHSANLNKLEDNLWSTKWHNSPEFDAGKAWMGGSKRMRYLIEEGISRHMNLFGGVILGDSFHEAADAIGAHSRTYPVGYEHSDQFWINALAGLATRMVANYGLTGASIVEAMMPGYLLIPSPAQMDIGGGEDEIKAIKKMKERPFLLEPILSKEVISRLSEEGEDRDNFVEIIHYTHLSHMDYGEVEAEVACALAKVKATIKRGHYDNWMDRCSEIVWEDSDNNDSPAVKFSEGLDRFIENSMMDWRESAARVRAEKERISEWAK